MGLRISIWRLMLDRLPRGELLAFGCPDVLFPWPDVPDTKHIEAVRATHGYTGRSPDPEILFRENGWRLTAIDIAPTRGIESRVNLNNTLPLPYWDRFDAVLDLGTGEHCFNIAQVFVNAHLALHVGGGVLHEHPLVMGNHGFWSTHPTAMLDFYGENGYDASAWINEGGRLRPADTRRFGVTADKSTTVGLAIKKRPGGWSWPVQARYR